VHKLSEKGETSGRQPYEKQEGVGWESGRRWQEEPGENALKKNSTKKSRVGLQVKKIGDIREIGWGRSTGQTEGERPETKTFGKS